MKPAEFDYHAPETLTEILALLADTDADVRVIAGGQSLMPMMRLRISQPEVLVDLNRCAALKEIEVKEGRLRLGAMVRQAEAMRDPQVAAGWPLISQALHHAGPIAVRNRATIGGTLAHADRTAELPAVAVAMGAVFLIEGVNGPREIEAPDFFFGDLTTAIEPGEMLVAVEFPALPEGAFTHFSEIGLRNEGVAIAGFALWLDQDGQGRVRDLGMAMIGVEPAPVRLSAAEEILRGTVLTLDLIDAAADAARDQLDPIDDPMVPARYRRHVSRTLVERSLRLALNRLAQPEIAA